MSFLARPATSTALRLGVLFGTASVLDERALYAIEPGLMREVSRHPWKHRVIRRTLRKGKQAMGYHPVRLLTQDVEVLGTGGALALQMLFYEGIARALEQRHGGCLSAVGFYSLGVNAAFGFADVFPSATRAMTSVRPVKKYIRDSLIIARDAKLYQSLFRFRDELPAAPETLLKAASLEGCVYATDRRGPRTCLLTGTRDDLLLFRNHLLKQGIPVHTTLPRPTVASHLPLIQEFTPEAVLASTPFIPPRCTLVSCTGDVVPAGCDDAMNLAAVYTRAMCKPMNSESMMRHMGDLCDRVFVVGSHMAQTFLKSFDASLRGKFEVAPRVGLM